MKNLLFLNALLMCVTNMPELVKAQTTWTETYGGSGYDSFASMQRTADNGYIFVGSTSTYGAGETDVWLLKTDGDGVEQWNQTFGGSDYDNGLSVQQTTDGGYIFTGRTKSYGAGIHDVWLIKTDGNGVEQWNQTFGGNTYDVGHSVQQTADGGYIVTGYTESYGAGNSDLWLIKVDGSGTEQWNQTIGGSGWDEGFSVLQTTAGDFIIAGYTDSYGAGGNDVWLVKTDASGTEQWNKTFGGTSGDLGLFVQQTIDNGFIISGYTESYGEGSADIWLVKTDNNGTEQWNQTFGGSDWDEGFCVQQTTDGGYIITGRTKSYGAGNYDVWLIKTNETGTEQWSHVFGCSEIDEGRSVLQTADTGFIVAGFTGSYGAGYHDAWIIKTDASGSTAVKEDNRHIIADTYVLYQNYPNPFNPVTTITYSLDKPNFVAVKIYNTLGREIRTLVNTYQNANSYSINFDAREQSSGIYYYKLQIGNNIVDMKKMLLMR